MYGEGVAAYGFISNSEAIVNALFRALYPALSLSKKKRRFLVSGCSDSSCCFVKLVPSGATIFLTPAWYADITSVDPSHIIAKSSFLISCLDSYCAKRLYDLWNKGVSGVFIYLGPYSLPAFCLAVKPITSPLLDRIGNIILSKNFSLIFPSF